MSLVVSTVPTIHLGMPKPALSLRVKVSARTTIVVTLLNGKSQKLASWVERVKAGEHKLVLPLPPKARHQGHDKVRITATGNRAPRTLPVTLR